MFSVQLRPTAQKERFLSNYGCSVTMHLVTHEPWGGGHEVSAARPANTASTLQPMDPGAVVIFRSYYLRQTFHKATAAMDMIPHGSEQS